MGFTSKEVLYHHEEKALGFDFIDLFVWTPKREGVRWPFIVVYD